MSQRPRKKAAQVLAVEEARTCGHDGSTLGARRNASGLVDSYNELDILQCKSLKVGFLECD